MNGKKVYRIMKTLRLTVNKKRLKNRPFKNLEKRQPLPFAPGEVWAMDFVFNRLEDGTSFRCLNMIDTFTREVPSILVSASMAVSLPVKHLEKLKETTKLPKHFVVDNGTEFANYFFMKWCRENNITVHFIDPGKPVQNAFIESFNGKFRKEFLDHNKFEDLATVRTKLKTWLKYYNEERPHSALDYLTPKEFAQEQSGMLVLAS